MWAFTDFLVIVAFPTMNPFIPDILQKKLWSSTETIILMSLLGKVCRVLFVQKAVVNSQFKIFLQNIYDLKYVGLFLSVKIFLQFCIEIESSLLAFK